MYIEAFVQNLHKKHGMPEDGGQIASIFLYIETSIFLYQVLRSTSKLRYFDISKKSISYPTLIGDSRC